MRSKLLRRFVPGHPIRVVQLWCTPWDNLLCQLVLRFFRRDIRGIFTVSDRPHAIVSATQSILKKTESE
jgi:hypothetical protein